MNAKLAVPGEARPVLCIHCLQVYQRWKINGGSEMSVKDNPLLTHEHKYKRLGWINLWEKILLDPSLTVTYLDEKWFYTTAWHQKIKKLPTGMD